MQVTDAFARRADVKGDPAVFVGRFPSNLTKWEGSVKDGLRRYHGSC